MSQDLNADNYYLQNQSELKLVKNAHLEHDGNFLKVVHYGTEIFSYNMKTQKATCLKDCSMTSNRQIRHAIDFFNVNPKDMTITENSEKWGYSGEITQ